MFMDGVVCKSKVYLLIFLGELEIEESVWLIVEGLIL